MVTAQLDERDDAMSRGFKKREYPFNLLLDTPLHESNTRDNIDGLGDKPPFFHTLILLLMLGVTYDALPAL